MLPLPHSGLINKTYLFNYGYSYSDHQVFHKWAQLTLPRNLTAGIVGFLKVDISIMTRAIQVMPVMVNKEEHKEWVKFNVLDNNNKLYICWVITYEYVMLKCIIDHRAPRSKRNYDICFVRNQFRQYTTKLMWSVRLSHLLWGYRYMQ